MRQRILSKLLVGIVLMALLWNTISNLEQGFNEKNTIDVRILYQVAGGLEVLLAVVLFFVLIAFIKRDKTIL